VDSQLASLEERMDREFTRNPIFGDKVLLRRGSTMLAAEYIGDDLIFLSHRTKGEMPVFIGAEAVICRLQPAEGFIEGASAVVTDGERMTVGFPHLLGGGMLVTTDHEGRHLRAVYREGSKLTMLVPEYRQHITFHKRSKYPYR